MNTKYFQMFFKQIIHQPLLSSLLTSFKSPKKNLDRHVDDMENKNPFLVLLLFFDNFLHACELHNVVIQYPIPVKQTTHHILLTLEQRKY
jgi:hypothetical protein